MPQGSWTHFCGLWLALLHGAGVPELNPIALRHKEGVNSWPRTWVSTEACFRDLVLWGCIGLRAKWTVLVSATMLRGPRSLMAPGPADSACSSMLCEAQKSGTLGVHLESRLFLPTIASPWLQPCPLSSTTVFLRPDLLWVHRTSVPGPHLHMPQSVFLPLFWDSIHYSLIATASFCLGCCFLGCLPDFSWGSAEEGTSVNTQHSGCLVTRRPVAIVTAAKERFEM